MLDTHITITHTQQTNEQTQTLKDTFSTFEEMLWDEAEEKVDERFKWNVYKGKNYNPNFYRGIKFEIFITLIFDYVIDILRLKNKLKIKHTPFTYKKYIFHKGRGLDIVLYFKKWTGNWIPLFHIELKNWTKRFMTPSLFKTHVLKRFRDKIAPVKLLITRGINFSVNTLTKIKNYNIKQITHNYVTNIHNLITNKLKLTNIDNKSITNNPKSVVVHIAQKHVISTRPVSNITCHTNISPSHLGDNKKRIKR
jgi:hypothetical protein